MLDSRHPSLSQSGQDGMWWVSHLMGWEAGTGLVLLPLVHLDPFAVQGLDLQGTAACTWSWGGCIDIHGRHRRRV